MTGRKVTRRASMRRKSMRSPSLTRSVDSKTPRSVTSEPIASGNASFSSSMDKLDAEEAVSKNSSQASLPVNNSSVRQSKSLEPVLSYAAAANEEEISSSEQLASELAAVKISDSKENLAKNEYVASLKSASVVGSQASLNELTKNESKASLNNLTRTGSKASLNDLADAKSSNGSKTFESAKSESNASLATKSNASINRSSSLSKFNNSTTAISEKSVEAVVVNEEAKKSADELVGVTLNESAAVVVEEEKSAKSCLAQKAAKCRCVIS